MDDMILPIGVFFAAFLFGALYMRRGSLDLTDFFSRNALVAFVAGGAFSFPLVVWGAGSIQFFVSCLMITVGLILWRGITLACPSCGKRFSRKTTSDQQVEVEESETLVQGATRMDGGLDRRYNNTLRTTETGIRHRKFKCSSCDHLWEERKPFKTSYTHSA